MTKSTTDHIVYDSTDSEFRCRHCEDKSVVQDGATAELCLMRLRGFLLMHKLCQPKAVPSPQLALPHTGLKPAGAESRKELPCSVDFEDPDPFDDCDPPINPIAAAHGHAMNQHAPSPDYGTGPDQAYAVFRDKYPVITSRADLREALYDALTDGQLSKLSQKDIEAWHPDSGIFSAVARWARIEWAHRESEAAAKAGKPGIPGLTIPARVPMPEALKEALGLDSKMPKKKRARKAPAAPTVER